jgi:sugar fermentation stimulation protein A
VFLQLVGKGHKAATVYLIQRGDCDVFAPCHAKDPVYGRLVLEAAAAGVQILPMCCTWVPSACKTAATLEYRGLATLDLEHGLQ